MIRLFTLSAIVLAALQAHGQEAQLPSSLVIAAKEGLQKIEEQKQHDIAFYAKNNKPEQQASLSSNTSPYFYSLYLKDEDNRYYNKYHDSNTDRIITSMPSPGPNLDYFFVDPCSSGNYDKVVKQ